MLDLPLQLLPEQFTLGELQAVCEEVLGRTLDKSSFRRRLADRDILEPIEGARRTGPFRYRNFTGSCSTAPPTPYGKKSNASQALSLQKK